MPPANSKAGNRRKFYIIDRRSKTRKHFILVIAHKRNIKY